MKRFSATLALGQQNSPHRFLLSIEQGKCPCLHQALSLSQGLYSLARCQIRSTNKTSRAFALLQIQHASPSSLLIPSIITTVSPPCDRLSPASNTQTLLNRHHAARQGKVRRVNKTGKSKGSCARRLTNACCSSNERKGSTTLWRTTPPGRTLGR
jgi:hypothetical protein